MATSLDGKDFQPEVLPRQAMSGVLRVPAAALAIARGSFADDTQRITQ